MLKIRTSFYSIFYFLVIYFFSPYPLNIIFLVFFIYIAILNFINIDEDEDVDSLDDEELDVNEMIFSHDLNYHDINLCMNPFYFNYNLDLLNHQYATYTSVDLLDYKYIDDLINLEYISFVNDCYLNEYNFLLNYILVNKKVKDSILLTKEQFFIDGVLKKKDLFFDLNKSSYSILLDKKHTRFISMNFSFISNLYPKEDDLSDIIRLNQNDILNFFIFMICLYII